MQNQHVPTRITIKKKAAIWVSTMCQIHLTPKLINITISGNNQQSINIKY
jgi:hypothetical protein